MTTFDDTVRAWVSSVETDLADTWFGVTRAVQDSIVEGSPVTGAPGQPVQTSNLKTSWQAETIDDNTVRIETMVKYAQAIEDGIGPYGPMTVRSEVGGFYSVELTRVGFVALVADVVEQVKAAGGTTSASAGAADA